jgi:hypothetical protein
VSSAREPQLPLETPDHLICWPFRLRGNKEKMIWAKRQFRFAEYAPYMERLDRLMLANPSMYSQFIMVSTDVSKPALSNYYVGVPDQSFLAEFDGFDIVPESQLPNEIDTVLIADATTDEFKSRFRFRKR